MRRRFMLLILCLCLVSALSLNADASFYDAEGTVQYVVDQADLLTDQEHIYLEGIARELSNANGCDVLIAAVADMDGYTADEYAALLNSGHWWDSEHAVLFLLAMEEREWYIATFGNAIYIFTDYGINEIGESVVPWLSEGSYCDGFAAYLSMLPSYFNAWQDGFPIDNYGYIPEARDEVVRYTPARERTVWSVLPLSLLIGIAAAGISLFAMRSSMNTKRRQHSAGDYLKSESYQLRIQQDIFLYSNLSKTRRQQNTGSSHGGGSSIHKSSGGRSHGGRGGRF